MEYFLFVCRYEQDDHSAADNGRCNKIVFRHFGISPSVFECHASLYIISSSSLHFSSSYLYSCTWLTSSVWRGEWIDMEEVTQKSLRGRVWVSRVEAVASACRSQSLCLTSEIKFVDKSHIFVHVNVFGSW